MKKNMNEKAARRPRTVIERIQDKADAVAKRYHDDRGIASANPRDLAVG